MPITITTHHEVFLVEHDTIAGMLRETADLVEELEHRDVGRNIEIELEVGLIGCRLRHGIRVFYRAEIEDTGDEIGVLGSDQGTEPLHSDRAHPALVLSRVEGEGG